jgi:hypothetical protein
MSDRFHATARAPIFTGCGYRPDLMPAHHAVFLTGMIGVIPVAGLPMI